MKKLLIVESPTEKKTVSAWLDKDFSVEATCGHFKNDSDKKLDINLDKLLPNLKNSSDKRTKDNLAKIKKQVDIVLKSKGVIYIQTDDDREGEGIAWSVVKEFGLKKGQYKRVLVNALEKKKYLEAIENAKDDILWDRVEEFFARKVLDKFIGFGISPVIWEFKPPYMGMGVGRVQSPALYLLAKQERKIQAFSNGKYYTIHCEYENGIIGDLMMDNLSKEESVKIYKDIKNIEIAKIDDFEKSKYKKNPKEPFKTSTIQQVCSSNFSMSPDVTMDLLQDGFRNGLNTYMRTDFISLPPDFLNELEEYIKKEYGAKYFLAQNAYDKKIKSKKNKSNNDSENEDLKVTEKDNTQAGHVGIYSIVLNEKDLNGQQKEILSNKDYFKIYDLIKKRTVASQMTPAIYDNVRLITKIGDYEFISRGKKLIDKGFLIAYNIEEDGDDSNGDEGQNNIPNDLVVGEELKIKKFFAKEHDLRCPSRYSSASLIGEMESLGIGRPSTFATTIKKLIKSEYIEVSGAKQMITVTDKGMCLIGLLEVIAPRLIDANFTSYMEDKLDIIAEGKEKRIDVVRKFLDNEVYTIMNKVGISFSDKGEIERIGKMELTEDEKNRIGKSSNINTNCPCCGGGEDVYKKTYGKFGYYFKCSSCGLQHSIKDTVLKNTHCPNCGKLVIKFKSKKGDIFFKCVDKDCAFFSNTEPGME